MATTPPVMLYAPGTNYKFHKKDLSRAIFCAQVVSQEDDAEANNFLQKHPGIQFDKIHMSLDYGDKDQRFLVAYATDATFIAFRGTKTLKNVTDTFHFDENCGSYFHKGFYKRSEVFNVGTGPHVPMFELLSKPERRIILCGHAVGGAVSHMILLRFLLYYGKWDRIKDNPNSIISIAFGAPHVCDQKVAEEVNRNSNFKERFINFVNEADPVPRLLHNLRGTVAAGLRAQGTKLFNSPDKESWKHLVDRLTNTDTKETNPPKFHPIGQYAFLGMGPTTTSVLPAGGNSVGAQLQQLEFSAGNLKYQTAASYHTALVNANLIDSPRVTKASESRPSLTITRPEPVVAAKNFTATDAGRRYVILEGSNFSFLRKTVTLDGIECPIIHQSESELWVKDLLGRGTSNAMIWTWFGHTSVQISENGKATTDPDSAAYLFPKIVQTWVLMAKVLPRNGGDSWEKHQDCLDNIVQCVNEEVPKKKLSSCLEKIRHGKGDISEDITEAVNMGNEVKKFMQTSLQIDYKPSFTLDKCVELAGKPIGAGFAAMAAAHGAVGISATAGSAVAAGAALAAVALPIVGWILIGIGLATLFGGATYVLYRVARGYHRLINSTKVLDLAIKEVLQWKHSTTNKDNSTDTSKERKLEFLVDKASDQFKNWVHTAHAPHSTEIQLKSDEFQEATPESMFRFLKRIKIETESRSIYRDTVAGKCFVGILGAEDIGKSTFVRKALVRNKSTGPLPERALDKNKPPRTLADGSSPQVGMGSDDHTKEAQLYQVANNLWLVDFPGANSIAKYADYWQRFSALPSFVVLLLQFKGDLKQDQKDMYETMKAELNTTDIIVAFNKVDTIRPDTYMKGLKIREYFEAQRRKTSKALGCDKDQIHYLCLNPDPDLDKRFKLLKEQGILDFEDFYVKVSEKARKWQYQLL